MDGKQGGDTIDLTVDLSIKPDSRITKNTMKASKEISGIGTGIVEFNDIPLIKRRMGTAYGAIWPPLGNSPWCQISSGWPFFTESKTLKS